MCERIEVLPLQRLEKSFSSLAVCYVFLASLAVLLLIYARVELQANPPDWSNLIAGVLHGSISIRDIKGAEVLAGASAAFFALRNLMHTTWLFFGVFGVVWLACLVWMQIERHRRGIEFARREAFWIAGFTILIFAIAVLYGLGTNGVLASRFPGIVPVSDIVALGIIFVLPLAAWSRLDRLQEEQEDAELCGEDPAPGRSQGFLGLNDDATNTRLVESLSRLEVKPVELHPAVHAFHPEVPSEPPNAEVSRLSESADEPEPAVAQAPESSPPSAGTAIAPAGPSLPAVAAASNALEKPSGADMEGFRHRLAAMNQSWQRIEAVRCEIDDWFEQRSREAIARLDAHREMGTSAVEKSLFQDFPPDKLASIDAEWAEIYQAVLDMSRWFDEVRRPDQRK